MKYKCIATLAVAAVLAFSGALAPVSAEEICTTETFPNLGSSHNQFVGVIGNLNFNGGFAGFNQATWFGNVGSYLWPQCADDVLWMPVDLQNVQSTTNPLTRIISFESGCCVLTSIKVASHESTAGTLTIRALDENMQQIGSTVTYNDLDIGDGCVVIPTGFTECAAKIEISYSRGSELGIIEMTYCCGEDEGGSSCTPGYWKQPQHFGSWPAAYDLNDDFDTVFGTNYFNPDITLLQGLQANGGGVRALARHGVAGLLNAASNELDYPYSVAQVIALVQAGNKQALADANEDLPCPLERNEAEVEGNGQGGL